MTDYAKGQDFAALKGAAGDPTIFNTEFNLVVTASATKADKASPTFTGTVVVPALSAAVSHTGDVTKTSPIQSREVYMHAFATGVKMAFFQVSAPLGWTQDVANNDALLRVVSGGGGGTGGTGAISTGSSTISGSTAISIAQMPAHTHALNSAPVSQGAAGGGNWLSSVSTPASGSTGGGAGHTHTLTAWQPKYIDMIVCTKD